MSQKESLKFQILNESEKIIGQVGVEGLSLRKIAKDLKVTHQAPYHYFPDKEALLFELKKMGFTLLKEKMSLESQGFQDPFEKMEALGLAYFDFCVSNPGYFRAMFSSIKSAPGVRVQEAQETFAMVLEGVHALMAKGFLKDAVPDIQAMICWTTMHGLVSLALDRYPVVGGKYESRALAKQMIRQLHTLMGRRVGT